MRSRPGTPKATVAVSHKLARLVSALLTKGQAYVGRVMEDDERTYAARRQSGLAGQAEALGDRLEPRPTG